MASKKLAGFMTGTENVEWAYLFAPDTKFGVPGNHNITLEYTGELKTKMEEILAESGATKINGVYDQRDKDKVKTGKEMVKFKSVIYTQKGLDKFPCVDSHADSCSQTAFGGDKVRLSLKPAIIERDNTLSFYLNGVQIIEKNESSGFEVVDDGYVGVEEQVLNEVPTPETVKDHPFGD